MATAYEVDQWKDRCRMLTALLNKSRSEKEALTRRIRDNSEEAKTARAIADGLEWEVEDLKAQNAKLKELVRDMYGCGDSCTHCKHWNQGDGFYCDLGVGWKARRVKELGIEVDDE